MISFHKLRRLIVAGAIMQRIWPSYEDLFLQIQGTVKEVILYTGPEVVPASKRLSCCLQIQQLTRIVVIQK